MRIVPFLACLFILSLGACAEQSDFELQRNVIGTWTEVETRPGVKVGGTDTYRSDGQFVVVAHVKKDGAAPFDLQASGEWRIDKGMLVTVITKTDNPTLAPVGDVSRDKIVNITARTLELESKGGRRLFRERQP